MQFNPKEYFKKQRSVTECINSVHLSSDNKIGSSLFSNLPGYPLVPSINLSTAHGFVDLDDLEEYHKNHYTTVRYSRDSSTLVLQLEKYLTKLFTSKYSLLFNSGMSAIAAALVPSMRNNTNIITFGAFYRKTLSIIELFSKNYDIKHINISNYTDIFDSVKDSENNIIFIESPANPFLNICDIKTFRKFYPKSLIVYDVTLQGLLNGQSLYESADIIVSSCTKYISGHNDFLGGFLVTRSKDLFESSWSYRSTFGGIMDNQSAYLLFRSLRTYDLRINCALDNCSDVLQFLSEHPHVKELYYPGQYSNQSESKFFLKHFSHGGSLITFEVDNIEVVKKNIPKLRSSKMAPSFGSIDTLFEIPALMSHYNKTEEELIEIKLNNSIFRLSVGNEPIEYILNDLELLFSE